MANGALVFLMLLTVTPLVMLIFLSTKDNLDILMNIWGIPKVIKWANYTSAFDAVKGSMGNSLFVAALSIAGSLTIASLSGYVFARHQFPFKTLLYSVFIGVMMIPGIVTLVPMYSMISKMHLTSSFLGLILPYTAGLQLFGILITRTYFETLPGELFEAAKIDGGTEFYLFARIALPLSVPVLLTIAIVSFIAVYGDYLWPLLVLTDKQVTLAIAVVKLNAGGRSDYGLTFAGYVIGSVPTVIIVATGMKYYLQGMVSGAIKG
jgi:ABC-type glycerol-3-phosphate transport system permease component